VLDSPAVVVSMPVVVAAPVVVPPVVDVPVPGSTAPLLSSPDSLPGPPDSPVPLV